MIEEKTEHISTLLDLCLRARKILIIRLACFFKL